MKLLYVLVALLVMTQVIQVQALLGRLALTALRVAAFGFRAGRTLFRLGRRGFGRRRGGFSDFGGGRWRRDLTTLAAADEQETRVEGLQMDAYFAAVQLGDEDGCGLRLVCELHTMDPAQLGEEEDMILALFGANVPSSGRADSPKRPYDAAAQLGRRAGAAEVCAETFQACQYDSQTLIEAIHTSPEQ